MRLVDLALRDVDRVAELSARCFDPRYGENWTAAQFRSGFAIPGYVMFGIEDGGQLIAFAITRTLLGEGELLLLGTDPERRREGLGGLLLDHWRSEVFGEQSQFLEMRSDNPALSFYRNHGFSEVGRRPNYYTGRDGTLRDALTMRRLVVSDS